MTSNSKPMPETAAPLATPRDQLPASEWASNTLNALDHPDALQSGQPTTSSPTTTSSPPVATHSAPETPGIIGMPGSFPLPKRGPPLIAVPAAVATDAAAEVQGVASGAFQTAKDYAQYAAQGAQSAVQTAGGKVGEYLPTSVAAYLPTEGQKETQRSTLASENDDPPSTSVEPSSTTTGTTDISGTSPIQTTTNNNNVAHPLPPSSSSSSDRHTGYIPGTLQDDTSLAKLPEERRLENLPSHDDESATRLGKSGGVGALPGSAGESSVALLPDERSAAVKEQQQGGSTTATSTSGGGASTDASVRTLFGSGTTGYMPSPLAQSQFVPRTMGREHAFSRDEGKVFASKDDEPDVPDKVVDTKAGNDEVSGARESDTAGGLAGGLEPVRAVGAGSGGLAGAGNMNTVTEADVPKKSGFIHKVKGEMKIISGKMSHNETKIEEGRKMMGKN